MKYGVIKVLNVSNPLIFDPLIIDIYSCKNKHIIKNKNSPIIIASAATKKQNNSISLISVVLTESICSHKNKYANIKNDNNKWNKILIYIRIIRHQHLQKNCKIITKNNLNESERDKISDTIDKNIEKKELRTSNFRIKVCILCSLILFNSFALNFTKQKSISLLVSFILNTTKHNLQNSLYQTQLEKN